MAIVAFMLEEVGDVLLRDKVPGTVVSVAVAPPEAYPQAIVDPDAALPRSIASELLKPVPWRDRQVLECSASRTVSFRNAIFCISSGSLRVPSR